MSTLADSWTHFLMKLSFGRITLSCHFAFDLHCDKAEVHCAEARFLANIALCESLCRLSSVAMIGMAVF